MRIDHIIVGSGLTGATLARLLTDAGRHVLVFERRPRLAGNIADDVHPSGIRYHRYGPHLFRTNSERIWQFAQRFGDFYRYEHRACSLVDGRLEQWPVSQEYIERECGKNWKPAFAGTPTNFEEASLAMMPRIIYERFVKGYTEKQWGVPAHTLSAKLAKRFAVAPAGETRFSDHKYQALPELGYSAWIEEMLEGIPVILNCDFLREEGRLRDTHTIFTGSIDEFFGFRLGKLHYRAQERELVCWRTGTEDGPWGNTAQTNYPSRHFLAVRHVSWKRMMHEYYRPRFGHDIATHETPFTPTDPDRYEYPFPDEHFEQLHSQYENLAALEAPHVLFAGRLGEGRYLDMDQAIARAFMHFHRIMEKLES